MRPEQTLVGVPISSPSPTYDRPAVGGTEGATPVKPDPVGGLDLISDEYIACQVKEERASTVVQTALYACCLLSKTHRDTLFSPNKTWFYPTPNPSYRTGPSPLSYPLPPPPRPLCCPSPFDDLFPWAPQRSHPSSRRGD